MPENQGNARPEGHVNALPAGHVVDKYRIGGVLGSGGFGIVYRGQHPELGDVAIKEYLPLEIAVRVGSMVQPHSSQSSEVFNEGLRRFLEEAKQLVEFKHPNVVRCRDFFRANSTAYLVMDFEDGTPLSKLLLQREEQGKLLHEEEIKQIVLPLLDGLAEVHAHDVLHRDIKPANIFIRKSTEEPVLIDFGAAKQGFSEHTKSVWAHTQGYAPMEQIEQDGKLGPWTDIYAVGAVMWRIVAGNNPPRAEDRMSAKLRRNDDPMKSAVKLGEGRYSAALLKVIDKCLSLRENGRYQSVEKLGRALRRTKPLSESKEKSAHEARYFAKLGYAWAQFNLGCAYYNGKGVPTDEGEAVKWLQMAAEQGNMWAQDGLGHAYYHGRGVPQNRSEAVKWWRLAAEQGSDHAQLFLGIAYSDGKGVPQDMSVALEWWRAAANRGNDWAHNFLGEAYYSGGASRNTSEAVNLARRNAERGDEWAQYFLGYAYSDGHGVSQDKSMAVKWWLRASEQGLDHAQVSLGEAYFAGKGVQQDKSAAVKWWRRAAEQGYNFAQYYLGIAYSDGEGVSQDYREAYIWYSLAVIEDWDDAAAGRDYTASKLSAADLSDAQNEVKKRRSEYSHAKS